MHVRCVVIRHSGADHAVNGKIGHTQRRVRIDGVPVLGQQPVARHLQERLRRPPPELRRAHFVRVRIIQVDPRVVVGPPLTVPRHAHVLWRRIRPKLRQHAIKGVGVIRIVREPCVAKSCLKIGDGWRLHIKEVMNAEKMLRIRRPRPCLINRIIVEPTRIFVNSIETKRLSIGPKNTCRTPQW